MIMRNIMRNFLKTFVIFFTATIILTSCGGGGGGSGAAPVATTSGVDYTYVGNFNVDGTRYSVIKMNPDFTFSMTDGQDTVTTGTYSETSSRSAAGTFLFFIERGSFLATLNDHSIVLTSDTIIASGDMNFPINLNTFCCPGCGHIYGQQGRAYYSKFDYREEDNTYKYIFQCSDCGIYINVRLRDDQVVD